MSLTQTQLTALGAAIAADPALSAFPLGSDGALALAQVLNAPASPTFTVWRTDAKVSDIADAINWALYTPADAADTTTIYTNRALLAQTKQMNLQLMLQGRTTLDCSKANIRAGLRDAVIQVPTGVGGAPTAPGGASGATVLTACTRAASLAEKILAGSPVATGTVTANLLGFEGTVTYQDVQAARGG